MGGRALRSPCSHTHVAEPVLSRPVSTPTCPIRHSRGPRALSVCNCLPRSHPRPLAVFHTGPWQFFIQVGSKLESISVCTLCSFVTGKRSFILLWGTVIRVRISALSSVSNLETFRKNYRVGSLVFEPVLNLRHTPPWRLYQPLLHSASVTAETMLSVVPLLPLQNQSSKGFIF